MRTGAFALLIIAAAPLAAVAREPKAPRPFPELVAEFRAATGALRDPALRSLARHRTAECVRFLDEVRRTDADAALRLRAIQLMGQVGVDPARTLLEEVLDRGDRTQRAPALDALAAIRPPIPPERFLAALAQREDAALRPGAARALGQHPREDVARRLAEALVETAPPPAEPGAASPPSTRPGGAPGPAADEALRGAAREALRALVAKAPVDAWLVNEALAARSPFAAALPDLLRVAGACPHAGLGDVVRAHARSPLGATRAAAADVLGEVDAGKRAEAMASLDVLAELLRDREAEVVLSAGLAVTRIGPAGRALVEVLALARSRNPGLKALGVGALASCRDEPKAVKAAADAIDDPAPPVRAAAVATLRALGTKEAVTALVGGLKKNDDGRLHAEILDALQRLTGARPGPDHEAWSRWWSLVKDDFVLPAAGAEAARPRTGDAAAAGASRTRDVPPTYYGSEVVSRRVAFVVDVSGSMSARVPPAKGQDAAQAPTRLEVCQRELKNVIQGLADGTALNLVPFDDVAQPWKERAIVLGRAEREAALGAVRALKPGGGTNIFDPLELALLDPSIDTVYLLSDGAPGAGKFTREEDILREVRKLNAVRRVAIHTISVGTDSPLMRKLAQENGGNAVVAR